MREGNGTTGLGVLAAFAAGAAIGAVAALLLAPASGAQSRRRIAEAARRAARSERPRPVEEPDALAFGEPH
jgi:gas vesicle protein